MFGPVWLGPIAQPLRGDFVSCDHPAPETPASVTRGCHASMRQIFSNRKHRNGVRQGFGVTCSWLGRLSGLAKWNTKRGHATPTPWILPLFSAGTVPGAPPCTQQRDLIMIVDGQWGVGRVGHALWPAWRVEWLTPPFPLQRSFTQLGSAPKDPAG